MLSRRCAGRPGYDTCFIVCVAGSVSVIQYAFWRLHDSFDEQRISLEFRGRGEISIVMVVEEMTETWVYSAGACFVTRHIKAAIWSRVTQAA